MRALHAQSGDMLLPIAVIAVVGMMIFPLPPVALDFLLMCNITIALVLLLAAVYLSEPDKFTSLPTILLLSTLFRLGLNISTTRQILSEGVAPDVIVTFGNFVVHGNLAVGVVVFIIVTLVQFLVIAKGAERVAEVAARFTLDALPGKQMSIDADLRAGIINVVEAKEKRRELQREAKLYGALDGAMKFVKGDAIAGLVITFVNITAGLYVGMQQQQLSFGEALQRYTIFTIGDGLCSQIPALLVAVAAGIAVTRVSDENSSFVGRDILLQLGQEPQAIRLGGAVLVLLACIPGLPTISFLLSGIALIFAAQILNAARQHKDKEGDGTFFRPKVYSPLVLRLSSGIVELLRAEGTLPKQIQSLRAELFENWGILVPDPQFDVVLGANSDDIEILLNGVPLLLIDRRDVRTGTLFSEYVITKLKTFIEANLTEFISDSHTRTLFEVHNTVAEDLINSLIPEVMSVTCLTKILRGLLEERISIRELSTILQTIVELVQGDNEKLARSNEEQKKIARIVSAARIALRRGICRTLSKGTWQLSALSISFDLYGFVLRAVNSNLPLLPEIRNQIAKEIRKVLSEQEDKTPIIITGDKARSYFSELLRENDIRVPVLSTSEISPETKVNIVGEIGLKELQEIIKATKKSEIDLQANGVKQNGGISDVLFEREGVLQSLEGALR